jgi:hypothetical protein
MGIAQHTSDVIHVTYDVTGLRLRREENETRISRKTSGEATQKE